MAEGCICGAPLKPLRKYCSRSCAATVNNKKRVRNRLENYCRTCGTPIRIHRVFCNTHIGDRRNRPKRLSNYSSVKKRRLMVKLKAVAYKGGCCKECGYKKCLRAMGFHHRDPAAKLFGFGQMSNLSWSRLLTELDKCDLLMR